MAPVYAVMGYLRSGTSMLMECLMAGGMDAAYEPGRTTPLGEKHYELSAKEQATAGFPKGYEGRLIKMLADLPASLPPFESGIKAVWMHRPAQQVFDSWLRAFGKCPFDSPGHLEERRSKSLAMVKNRRDVDLIEIEYEDLLERPQVLRQIGEVWGVMLNWPAAEAVIDRSRNHFPAKVLV